MYCHYYAVNHMHRAQVQKHMAMTLLKQLSGLCRQHLFELHWTQRAETSSPICCVGDSTVEMRLLTSTHTDVYSKQLVIFQCCDLPGRQHRHVSVDALQGRGEIILWQQTARGHA